MRSIAISLDKNHPYFPSTQEVADQLGMHRVTVERAIAAGEVNPPMFKVGASSFRLWTPKAIKEAEKRFKNARPGRPTGYKVHGAPTTATV